MEQPNVLLLDEPTNDLDVETLTVLEDYLENFEGVVIVVSHDRYFLDRTVDHLLVFQEDNSVVEFPGGYSDWLEKTREQEAAASAAKKQEEQERQESSRGKTNTSKRLSYMEQRELDELGPKMAELEDALEALDEEMAQNHDDYALLQELTEKKQSLAASLDDALERWMELEEKQGNG